MSAPENQKLQVLEESIRQALAAAQIDEASLRATWPAATDAAAAGRLLGAGAVIEINTAAAAAAEALSFHIIPRDGVDATGVVTSFIPPLPGGSAVATPFSRAALNSSIRRIARDVVSTVGADGVISSFPSGSAFAGSGSLFLRVRSFGLTATFRDARG